MKLRSLLITLSAIAAVTAREASASINYNQLYLVGDATPAEWDASLPEEMTAIGNDCFIWDGILKTGEFKFLNRRGDWGSSIVAPEENMAVESGPALQRFALVDNTEGGHDDFKFYNRKGGWMRIVVDLRNMTVNMRHPVLGITGPGALGWYEDRILPVFADDEGNVSWTGQLQQGQIKFLSGDCDSWQPCYNAVTEDQPLTPGTYGITDQDPNDYKFMVTRAGIYTLKFNLIDNTLQTESSTDSPEAAGTFGAEAGRYLTALDRGAARMHFGPVPNRLFIGTGAGDCAEIERVEEGVFSSTVELRRGEYYKLCYDPENMEQTALSPNRDTDLTEDVTANVAPMHGYSYTVPADGRYEVTADFTGDTPQLYAMRDMSTSITAPEMREAVRVTVTDRVITVSGDCGSVEVFTPAGVLYGRGRQVKAEAGIYIVKTDNNVHKIAVN